MLCVSQGEAPPPSSRGTSSAPGAVFYFTVNFFPTGVVIKAEIWVFRDVQVSLPSSLAKPWPSWCFRKHMEGLRFHVSQEIHWFHKHRKVKCGLSSTFTFLQCLQEKEKEDVKKFASGSVGQSSAGGVPWGGPRAAVARPWPRLSGAPHSPELPFGEILAAICVTAWNWGKNRNRKPGWIKCRRKNEITDTVILVSLYSCAFSNVSGRPLAGERQEGCRSLKNYATYCVTFSDWKELWMFWGSGTWLCAQALCITHASCFYICVCIFCPSEM